MTAGDDGTGWDGPAAARPSGGRGALAVVRSAPRTVLVGLLRLYQQVVSPLYGPTCRFYPSCSQYAVVSIDRHGAVRGVGLAAWRLLRCNPWNSGGVDDVPPARGQDAHEHLQHHQH